MATRKEKLEQFNRDNILVAAGELFEKKGIGKTTMDEIAKVADYSKSTVYVYFKNKEEIFGTLVNKAGLELAEEVKQIVDSSTKPEKAFSEIGFKLYEFHIRYGDYLETMVKADRLGMAEASLLYEIERLVEMYEPKKRKKTESSKARAMYLWTGLTGIVLSSSKRSAYLQELGIDLREFLETSFVKLYKGVRD